MTTEVKNADELIKAVESKVQATLTKYEKQVEENGVASKEAKEELIKLSEQYAEISEDKEALEVKFQDLQQKLTEGFDGQGKKVKTVGESFIESDKFLGFKSGDSNKATIKIKNTVLTETSSDPNHDLVAEDRLNGIVPLAFRALNVLDVIPMGTTSSDTIKYGKEASFTNNATETAQGAAATESDITTTSAEAFVREIPTFLKTAKSAIDDAPALQSFLNTRLGHMVRHKLQVQVLNGNGTAPNISGLTDTGNFTAFTPTASELETDAINRAKYANMGSDHNANLVVMNPTDFGTMERVKSGASSNDYAAGNGNAVTYINNGMQALVWGLPVVLSNDMTAGKFLCMDRFACQLFMRKNLEISMYEQDEDNAQKGLITIKATTRAAFAVYSALAIRYGDLTA